MDYITAISTFVQNVGVPVALCCAVLYLWNKEREEHRETEYKLLEAINNNTVALTKLSERLEVEKNDN